ncbi:hypothetical protein [Kitasatospora griseola]|uniref:hypothetical protein n=1 Tax=Kitasatospora griseola TaxID=2064 RepID=UPI00343308CD
MRRLLTSLALTGATALLPMAGLVAVAPEAHASTQQCVTAAVQAGVPASLAEEACSLAAGGDVGACVDLLSGLIPAPIANTACQVAAGLGSQAGPQKAGRVPATA